MLTRLTFATLAGPLIAVIGGIMLVLFAMWAAITQPILAAIPIGLFVAGLWFIVWRDKKEKERLEAELQLTARPRRRV